MVRLLALLLVLAAPPSAQLVTRPPATVGTTWRATVVVRGAEPPLLRVVAAHGATRVRATARRVRGRYPLRLVFPAAGSWSLATTVNGRVLRLGSVTVAPAEYRLERPGTILLDGGTLYVAEGGRQRVLAVDLATNRVRVAATGFDNPFGLALLPGGDVLVTSRNTIAAFTPATRSVRPIAALDGVEFGPAAVRDGHAYVGSGDERVRRVDLRTGALDVIAGNGVEGDAGDGGPAVDAEMTAVHGIAFDRDGTMLVADTGNDRVRRIDLARGTIAPFVGDLQAVGTIALAPDGSLWAGEMDAGRVTRVAPDGTRSSVDGFAIPCCIALAPDGTLYVVDSGRATLYRVAPGGAPTRIRLLPPAG